MQFFTDYTILAAIIGGIFAVIAAIVGARMTHSSKSDTPMTRSSESDTSLKTSTNDEPLETGISLKDSTTGPDKQEKTRVQLRQKHSVSLLKISESEMRLADVPSGRYGFGYGSLLLLDPKYLELRREWNPRFDFEYHKALDGSTFILGYVGHETAAKLDQNKAKGLDFIMYTKEWDEAPKLVGVNIAKIASVKSPRSIAGVAKALDIKSK